jgi:inner membrane protein
VDGSFLPNRSLGLKFLLVCVLAVLMCIPAATIWALIYERTSRAEQVVMEVGERYGGMQTFTGPLLAAPYRAVRQFPQQPGTMAPAPITEEGWYVVYPDSGAADLTIDTEERARGDLFKVRTYTAGVAFNGSFDLAGEPSAAPPGAVVDWTRAVILIGVSDPRGAQGAAEIQVNGATIQLEPGSAFMNVFGSSQWLVAPAGAFAEPGQSFTVTSNLQFTGVESIGVTPFARNTEISVTGDWPHVGYFGAFPPVSSDGGEAAEGDGEAFSARWSVPYVARGVSAAGDANSVYAMTERAVRVQLVDPTNPYQSVTRALKYALLFIGVVFLAYFLFETSSERRVHPAQYILVGLAQVVFYLLLLAIAERLGFDTAFVIAAGATVALISLYAGAIFRSRSRFFAALVSFSALYALIYLLMRLEDYALLAGSIAAFLAIAAVMWFTRNLDWYGLGLGGRLPSTPPPPPSWRPPGEEAPPGAAPTGG